MSICAVLALCTPILVAVMVRNVQPASDEAPEEHHHLAFAESTAD